MPAPDSDPWDQQASNYARELSELQLLRQSYERLVPEALAVGAPAAPEPRVRDGVILFSDLRGFTRLAEQLQHDPLLLFEMVNAQFAVAVPQIQQAGGVVEKFVGDGILASFGVRTDLADASLMAVMAAIGVIKATDHLTRRQVKAKAWPFNLAVGVSLASGPMVLGLLGTVDRAELGVLGDPVNVAARLVADAQPSEILMTEQVAQDVLPVLKLEWLGRQAVRGRIAAVDVRRLSLRAAEERQPEDRQWRTGAA